MLGETAVSLFRQATEHGRVTISTAHGKYETPVAVEVALRHGKLVGFTTIKIWIDEESLAQLKSLGRKSGQAPDAEMWMLAVLPDQRHQGIGYELLKRQFARAAMMAGGINRVVARCYAESTQAKRLLLKLGFAVEADLTYAKLFRYRGA